jgi:hypothetical protein
MVRKAVVALAITLGLLGATSARASAQAIVGGVYVAAPPVYVQIGPAPGPGYVWVPLYHRWVFRGYDRPFYRRDHWEYGRR